MDGVGDNFSCESHLKHLSFYYSWDQPSGLSFKYTFGAAASPLRTHQPAQGPSPWGHRQFFYVVHLLLHSSSILPQRTRFPQSAQVFLLPPDELFWHSLPYFLPFRAWWPLSKKPPLLLCQSFHALYTHQAFLCLKCRWACLVSRCLGLLMCVKMSPCSEKKVQQEIPALAASEFLPPELFEEMPHEAAPDSSPAPCRDSLWLHRAGNISEAHENGS